MAANQYIGPLDGLRAIAISLVLIFHLNEAYLPGGFVGVDLFFVISGYIITKNIIVARIAGGFSLADFYRRRVTRLMPAVAATVIVSMVAASFVYSPTILATFGKSGTFSILSLANVYFWLHSGYFDADSQTNIFLHMWSLSVEEQFYLIWPFVVLAISMASKRASVLFGSIAIISFAATSLWFSYDPTGAFFWMPARIFQFALGATVAAIHLKYPSTFQPENELGASAIFLGGTLLIAVSAFIANGHEYHILPAALLPALGGAVSIFAINSQAARSTLGAAPVRYVGRRAYSLYLVHWPLMVMCGVFFGSAKPLPIELAIFACCFALAEILYRTVEARFRLKSNSQWNRARTVGAFALTLCGLMLVVNFWLGANSISNATTASYEKMTPKLWAKRSELGKNNLHCKITDTEPFSAFNKKDCLLEDVASGKILIMGDSLGAEAFIMFSQIFDPAKLMLAGGSGCLPVFPDTAPVSDGCHDLNTARYQWIYRPDVQAIVVSTNWQHWSDAMLKTTMAKLASAGKPIVLLGVRPRFTESVPKLLDSAVSERAKKDLTRYIAFPIDMQMRKIRNALKPYNDQFYTIHIKDYPCPKACPALTDDGALIYLDYIHLAANVAISLGKQIDRTEGERIKAHVTHNIIASP